MEKKMETTIVFTRFKKGTQTEVLFRKECCHVGMRINFLQDAPLAGYLDAWL